MLAEPQRQPRLERETSPPAATAPYFAGDVRSFELTRIGWVARLFRQRWFQFAVILPNQIIFWVALIGGFIGTVDPTRSFGTAITWYFWFFAVLAGALMVGRVWCQICPFGGFAEWIQRLTPWGRRERGLTLNRRWPERWAVWGIIPGALVFYLLTWVEEYYNVVGPGKPIYTSYLIIFVFALAIGTFSVFGRRTFCRYLCPLSAPVGIFSTVGVLSGFRTRDRERCLSCDTKECMRGSKVSYGCPWFEFPGSNATNQGCGLCTECFKGCPNDNVGLYLQPPLTNVHSPGKRRWDVAWALVLLWGIGWYQQWNALSWFSNARGTGIDDRLNRLTGWPHYPNPLGYLLLTGGVAAGYYLYSRAAARWAGADWRRLFTAGAYALIPVVGADYLARQLPKLWDHVTRVITTASDPFGLGWNLFGTARLPIYHTRLLPPGGVVATQVAVMAIATAAAGWAAWRIWRRDWGGERPRVLGALALAVLAAGAYTAVMYVAMQAAE
ncbi:MAG: 4Fe-4S binding protein [Thermaerobacter sp.]|nr:4Fe-4S binding protein [Thermaerobacter sp.]